MFKNKKHIFYVAVCLVIIFGVVLTAGYLPQVNANATAPEQYELTLLGESEIFLYIGDTYEECGFIATNEINENLNDKVTVYSTVDASTVGKYSIVYILGDITKTRTVTVVEPQIEIEPQEYSAIATTVANFSDEITLDYVYVQPDKLMPFGLITPSTAKESEKIPLIISLHGQSERGCSEKTFKGKFVINLMRNWEMQGFNAYVMFPHLTGNFYSESWNSNRTAEQFFELLDWFIEHYNVDPDKIIVQGQSMGGYGCLYMVAYHPEYFAACVPISAYNSNVNLSKLKDIAVRGYVGSPYHGEDKRSSDFVMSTLVDVFGAENINQREVGHNDIPILAYTEDLDEDNIPDLLEWMFEQKRQVAME